LPAETSASKTDHVHAEDIVYFSRDYERRDVFAETRSALGKCQSPNAHMLMKDTTAAEKCPIVHANVTAEQTTVGDDHIVANCAIVTEMRTGHQKILVADYGRAPVRAPAMDGAVFANDILIANLDLVFVPARTQDPAAARQ